MTDKLKILIAEDDVSSQMLMAISLKTFAREIIKVKTGSEAVEVCRNNPDINLVLMDIEMPEMDGYDATREIRKFNQNVVIVIQTAFALTGDSEKALNMGCNGYLVKPFNKGTLIGIIEKYFLINPR